MMTQTICQQLPLIDAAQSQKHVTHNAAIMNLDVSVQLAVISAGQMSPPPSPQDGDRYIVGAGAQGLFVQKDQQIALAQGGNWTFLTPYAGWRCYVKSQQRILVYDGQKWADL